MSRPRTARRSLAAVRLECSRSYDSWRCVKVSAKRPFELILQHACVSCESLGIVWLVDSFAASESVLVTYNNSHRPRAKKKGCFVIFDATFAQRWLAVTGLRRVFILHFSASRRHRYGFQSTAANVTFAKRWRRETENAGLNVYVLWLVFVLMSVPSQFTLTTLVPCTYTFRCHRNAKKSHTPTSFRKRSNA